MEQIKLIKYKNNKNLEVNLEVKIVKTPTKIILQKYIANINPYNYINELFNKIPIGKFIDIKI